MTNRHAQTVHFHRSMAYSQFGEKTGAWEPDSRLAVNRRRFLGFRRRFSESRRQFKKFHGRFLRIWQQASRVYTIYL